VIGGERRVAIAAFTANGPDTRFSGDGIVSFDLAPGDETLTAAYVEQDGSLVAVGHAGDRMLMVRVLPNGDVDRSFGGDGVVLDQVPGAAASTIEAITGAQAAGRFVIAGGATQASDGVKRLLVAQFGPPLGAISCTRLLGCATLTPVAAGAPLTPLSPQRPTGVIVQPEVAVCQPAKVGGGCVPCRTGSGCTSVGILVKRVVHGRAEYAGRVPFGPQRAGRRALRWNLKLDGRRVPHGTYVIRIRALRRGKVVEVSKPFRLRL
jgi:hypothetical protein